MEWISNPSHLISLVTLTVLEIVLGIDNIIFISILGAKLPAAQQGKARTLGLLLALSFLILVGVVLIADGFGEHIQKGYIYFAMAFSFGVEMLNIKRRRKGMTKPDSHDLRSPRGMKMRALVCG